MPKSRGGNLAVGTYLQRGSTPPRAVPTLKKTTSVRTGPVKTLVTKRIHCILLTGVHLITPSLNSDPLEVSHHTTLGLSTHVPMSHVELINAPCHLNGRTPCRLYELCSHVVYRIYLRITTDLSCPLILCRVNNLTKLHVTYLF